MKTEETFTAIWERANAAGEATILDTPEGIAYYHLCALKRALKLEKLGLLKRRPSIMTIVKKRTGIKTRSYDRLIAALQGEIDEAIRKRREG